MPGEHLRLLPVAPRPADPGKVTGQTPTAHRALMLDGTAAATLTLVPITADVHLLKDALPTRATVESLTVMILMPEMLLGDEVMTAIGQSQLLALCVQHKLQPTPLCRRRQSRLCAPAQPLALAQAQGPLSCREAPLRPCRAS